MEIVQLILSDFFAPCCYGWRRGDVWLYIGQSTNGLARLAHHHVIRRNRIKDNDELIVWRCDNVNALSDLERKLIRANKPLFNKANNDYDFAHVYGVSRSVLDLIEDDNKRDYWFQMRKKHGQERCDGKPEKLKRHRQGKAASTINSSGQGQSA